MRNCLTLMHLRCWPCVSLLLAFITTLGSVARAGEMSGRHIMILHGGLDTVWGTALFMVRETATDPEVTEIPVMLPKEMDDFQIQEGLEAKDVVPGREQGQLLIRKQFAPGEHFIAIGFKIPVTDGSAKLSFVAANAIPEFNVWTKPNGLSLDGKGFTKLAEADMNGQIYQRIVRENLGAGEEVQVIVGQVPQGRKQFWWLGGIAAVALLAAGFVLTTRTRVNAGKEEAIASNL